MGEEPSFRRQERFVDIHCHCLSGLDDGPESFEESLALCRALVEDNVRVVVATPHQLGRFETRTNAKRICEGVRRINEELFRREVDLIVLPGAEVRLDERICDLLAGGKILTLANKRRHLLLELPSDVFIDVEPLFDAMAVGTVTPILAHPERNAPLLRHLQVLPRWRACGACLQVTAASVVGGFGRQAEEAAWELLARGWGDVVASDAHDVGRNRPYMKKAFARIAGEFGRRAACRLCIENPLRVVRGQPLVPACLPVGQEVR
jgi:protein-tyrosine phosphatase